MYVYRMTVDRVVDGDTIDATVDLGFSVFVKERIRLLGINAPETRGTSRERGLASKEWLEKRIEGRTLVVETQKDKTGKFGRMLGTISEPGAHVTINEEMVLNGKAVAQTY